MDDIIKCTDCNRRADPCFFMYIGEKNSICTKCYLTKMLIYARDNGFKHEKVKEGSTLCYNNMENMLDDFCLLTDYYSD